MTRRRIFSDTMRTFAVLAIAATAPAARAVDYTWASATTGGLWSDTTAWTPTPGAGGPTTADTVLLDTTASGTTRTVIVSAAASGTVATITLTQTDSGTNTLEIGRSTFRVTNALTLGASNGGVSRLFLDTQTGTTAVNATFSGGVTVNAGGMLSMGHFNPSSTSTSYGTTLTGAVTVSGGGLVIEPFVKNGTNNTASMSYITGALTMTSGSLAVFNTSTGSGATSQDRRLRVGGNLSITGGTVFAQNPTSGGLYLDGTTNTFKPDLLSGTSPQMVLQRGGDQSLLTNQVFQQFVARGTGVKTYTTEVTGENMGNLVFVDENTAIPSSRTTFKMGSNLTLASGRNLPATTNLGSPEPTTLRVDVGIDADAYTFDLTANSGVFTPTTSFDSGTGTVTYWQLSGTAGRIVANGFKFDTAGVGVSIGPGLVLDSRSGNNVANVLSLGSGTGTSIDPTSVFRYSGAAAIGTPSTLTSNRSIGDLEVASGALQISSLAGLQAVRVTGGTLDLGGNDLTVTSGSFGGGTTTSGTLTTSGLFTASDGTIAAALAGSGSFSKIGTGTATLSGANTYAGNTTVSAGTLILTASAALPGIVDAGRFSVASGATLGVTDGVDTTAVEGMLATGNFSAGSTAEIDTTGGDRTLSAALAGGYALRKAGGNTLTLTGAGSYTGGTTIAGGTLQLGTGGSIVGAVVNDGVLAFDRGDAVTLSGPISGAGGLVQSSTVAEGIVTLSGTNSYTGVTTVNSGTLVVEGNHSAATGGWYLPNNNAPNLNKGVTFAAGSVVNTAAGSVVQLGLLAASGTTSSVLTVLGSAANDGGLVIGRSSTFTIGSGGVWSQSGTMQLSPQGGLSATMNVDSGGLFTYTGAQTIALNSAPNNSGNGTVTIAGGTFVTSAGFEQLVSSTTTSNGQATLSIANGGLLRISQDIPALTTPLASGSGKPLRMTLGTGGGTIDTNGFSTAIGVVISGGGGLTKTGLGTLTLSATNTFSGPLTIDANAGTVVGSLFAGTNIDSLGSGTASVGAGSTLRLANASTTNTGVTISSSIVGSGTVQLDFAAGTTARNTTLSGLSGFEGTLVLSAASGVTGDKLNAGSSGLGTLAAALVIEPGTTFLVANTGSSTFSNGITVSGTGNSEGFGAIRFGTNATLGGAVSLAGDTTIGASSSGSLLSGDITTTATSTLTFGTPGAVQGATFSGSLGDGSGRLSLTKTQSGTLTLTGENTHTGLTSIQGGALSIGNGGGAGSLAGNVDVASGATLIINRSGAVTHSGTVNGAGAVTLAGSGTVTLDAVNTYSGGTQITGSGALNVSAATQVGSGTITLRAAGTSTATVLGLLNGVALPNAIELSQAGSNRNNITITGGAATLSGPITITGTGAGQNVFFNNGSFSTLVISGNITTTGSYTGSLSFRRNEILISGTINTPTSYVDFNSGGTTSITSTGNVWTRTAFQATDNVLRLGATDAHATGAYLDFSGSSTGGGFDLNGYDQTVAGFATFSAGTPLARIYNDAATDSTLTLAGLTTDRSSNVAITDGTAGGRVAVVMNSTGRTQTLGSATSSYTGGTTIVAGTIALGHANGLGGGGPLAVNGGALDLRGFTPTVGALSGSAEGLITSGSAGITSLTAFQSTNSTYAGVIEDGLGTVGFAKGGGGRLTLTGANTFTGATSIDGGTLVVNGSLASDVVVAAGATLAGSGLYGGQISGAGLVSVGNSPGIGTAASLDPSAGTDYDFEITALTPDWDAPSASLNDVLRLTGATPFAADLSGANEVNVLFNVGGAIEQGTYLGGFYADQANIAANVANGGFAYWVVGEYGAAENQRQFAVGSSGANITYSPLSAYNPNFLVTVSVVPQSVSFDGSTTVNGYSTQFVVVPEPGGLVLAGIGAAAAAWCVRRRRTVPVRD